MNNSLLVNVSKYASSDKTSPTENFVTEAFAWLLRNDSDVRGVLSRLLKSKGTDKAVPFDRLIESDSFDTQVNFNGKYPDMLWDSLDNEWAIVFEHKVWSELHENQLYNYRKFAEEQLGKEFILVLITAHAGQHRQNPDIALCWHEIAKEIERLDAKSEKSGWIRDEFIQLLKSHGLVDVSPINPLSISYYQEAKKLDKQLTDICLGSQHHKWPISANEIEVGFSLPSKLKIAQWGRIGLNFSTVNKDDEAGWEPALFFGFIIDGSDHLVDDLLENGPIAAVVLSLAENLQVSIKQDGYYDRLIEELRPKVPVGWKLSDRTEHGKMANKWHPLIIFKDLSEFFADAKTVSSQYTTYTDQMSAMQTLLQGCESFQVFCNEMRKRSLV
ncbi:PD-(D/E)XK nuclease family protein [Vibrio breoganii]